MRHARIYAAITALSLLVAFAAIYYLFDPANAVWMPKCLWRLATGTDCPGCGSQRMAHALMHGDFAAAWRANAFALCMIPVIVFLIFLEFGRRRFPRLYKAAHCPAAIYFIAFSILAWWILRNILSI